MKTEFSPWTVAVVVMRQPRYDPAVMGRVALVCLALLAASSTRLDAQGRPDVPPIPVQEQLRSRSDLEATLRVSPDRVRVDQTPSVTLVLRNTGRDRLLIPRSVGVNVKLRTYLGSGDEIVPEVNVLIDRWVFPMSVQGLQVLEPQETREIPLRAAGDRAWGHAVGEYQLEATYRNFSDWPLIYDVYEDGADQVWEGEIVTPRVSVTVLPLEAATERRLIEQLKDTGDSQARRAISYLGLGRSREAVAPLVQRFEVDPSTRGMVVSALAEIGGTEGVELLARVIDRLSHRERSDTSLHVLRLLVPSALEALVLQSRACEALPILVYVPGPHQQATAALEDRCPSLRLRLQGIIDAAPADRSTPERRDLADRASRAEWLLQELDRRSTPDAEVQTQASEPAADERPTPVEANRLAEYVRTVMEVIWGTTLDDELYGIALYGNVSTYLELRAALDVVTDDRRWQIAEAIQLLTFTANDPTQEEHLDGAYWDAWRMAHEGQSRREWALEALLGTAGWQPRSDASNALAYLARLPDTPREILDRAETHRSWRVRIAAALAVAEADLSRGVHLLVRELNNRYVAACQEAAERLSELVKPHSFSCYSPAERARAAEFWTAAVSAVPR